MPTQLMSIAAYQWSPNLMKLVPQFTQLTYLIAMTPKNKNMYIYMYIHVPA